MEQFKNLFREAGFAETRIHTKGQRGLDLRRRNQIIECAQNGENDMKLSIIVPVYNMASDGKLNYCLDSLAAQTISDYEVITVDDASTDESFSILLEYEKSTR